MTHKFVIRLMGDDGEMLGWCEEHIRPRSVTHEGKSACSFRAETSDILLVKAGTAQSLSVHWCDLDVVRTEPLAAGPVRIPPDKVGTIAQFHWTFKSVWLVVGEAKGHLPPITIGDPVVLTPEPATFGAGG